MATSCKWSLIWILPNLFFSYLSVGFTDGSKNPDCIGFTKFYYIGGCDQDARIDRLWLSTDEKMHKLECPIATTDGGAVVGCGLLLNSKNEWAVFFTVNGNLLGKLLLTHKQLMIYIFLL
jgi:hypothetical protein